MPQFSSREDPTVQAEGAEERHIHRGNNRAEDVEALIFFHLRDFARSTPKEIDHMDCESSQLRGGGSEEFAELLAHVLLVAAATGVAQRVTKVSELTKHGEKFISWFETDIFKRTDIEVLRVFRVVWIGQLVCVLAGILEGVRSYCQAIDVRRRGPNNDLE